MMDNNTNNALQQWLDHREQLMTIDGTATDVLYNEAITLCNTLHKQLATVADRDEYIAFLSTYANLCALREENNNKEIDIQDEIVELRRKQTEENRGDFLPKLSNSLFYAAQLHRKATNVHRAMECMEEHLELERAIAEQDAANGVKNVAVAQYFMANTYAAFGRNILAEEAYCDAIELFGKLVDDNNNDMALSMTLVQIIIEFADFHLASRMINNAIDRYMQAIEMLRGLALRSDEALSMLREQYKFMHSLYNQLGNEKMCTYFAQLIEELN